MLPPQRVGIVNSDTLPWLVTNSVSPANLNQIPHYNTSLPCLISSQNYSIVIPMDISSRPTLSVPHYPASQARFDTKFLPNLARPYHTCRCRPKVLPCLECAVNLWVDIYSSMAHLDSNRSTLLKLTPFKLLEYTTLPIDFELINAIYEYFSLSALLYSILG